MYVVTDEDERAARIKAGAYLVRAARFVVRLGEAGLGDEPWVDEIREHIRAADTAGDDIATLRGHVEAIRAIVTVHRIIEPPESPRQN